MNSPATVQRYRVTTMRDEGYIEDANGQFVEWEDHCRALEAPRKIFIVYRCRQCADDEAVSYHASEGGARAEAKRLEAEHVGRMYVVESAEVNP